MGPCPLEGRGILWESPEGREGDVGPGVWGRVHGSSLAGKESAYEADLGWTCQTPKRSKSGTAPDF